MKAKSYSQKSEYLWNIWCMVVHYIYNINYVYTRVCAKFSKLFVMLKSLKIFSIEVHYTCAAIAACIYIQIYRKENWFYPYIFVKYTNAAFTMTDGGAIYVIELKYIAHFTKVKGKNCLHNKFSIFLMETNIYFLFAAI